MIRSAASAPAALLYSQRRLSLSFNVRSLILSPPCRRLVIVATGGKVVKKDYYLRQISTDLSARIEKELFLTGEGTISECSPDLSPEAAAAAAAAASAASKAATYAMSKFMRRENELMMNANAAKGVIILIYIFLGLVLAFLIDCLKRAFRYVKKVVRSFEKPGVENLMAP